MIYLEGNTLVFNFEEVHQSAKLEIALQRTLRIPDDGKTYPLPASLGKFPIRHIDDYADNVPKKWIERGGVIIPMYQSEALWIYFGSSSLFADRYSTYGYRPYPIALKILTGKVNAVTGDQCTDGLSKLKQNYVVAPGQPWLDGYCVEKGVIRQFVAMPLGSGYTAEEQITETAEYGGIQIIAYPMKREVYEKLFKRTEERFMICNKVKSYISCEENLSMGLAPGGLMKQEIYKDKYGIDAWDTSVYSRCFIHIANSMVWRSITGENPPTVPITSKEYEKHGIPWFDYYNDNLESLEGSSELNRMKSVEEMGKIKGEKPLQENESVDPSNVIDIKDQQNKPVRENKKVDDCC